MFELSHDGGLLQKLHPFLLCWLSLQRLHGYLHSRAAAGGGGAPHTTIHCPKLTTAKVLLKSIVVKQLKCSEPEQVKCKY